MKEPIFKSYLNSNAGIINPVKGSGFINSSSQNYDTGVYSGVQAMYKGTGLAAANADGINYTFNPVGTLELWIKLDGWSCTGTSVSDGANHYILEYFGSQNVPELTLIYFASGQGVHFDLTDTGGYRRVTIASETWPADTWIFIAWVWDYNETTEKIRIYKGDYGSSVSKVGTGGSMTNFGSGVSRDMALGQRGDPGAGLSGFKGWLAGLTIYDFAKTDFSDRYNLRSGMNDLIVCG